MVIGDHGVPGPVMWHVEVELKPEHGNVTILLQLIMELIALEILLKQLAVWVSLNAQVVLAR